ncbi:MAG: hypothetical protein ACOX68_01825 [Candidatus Limivicinus sp.]|jgi:hypothetical protein
MLKKVAALLFALVLICGILPSAAFAVGNLPQPDPYPGFGFDGSFGGGFDIPTVPQGDSGIVSPSVAVPVINSEPSDSSGLAGGIPVTLRVGASSFSGGSLRYQWYSCGNGMNPIPGANSEYFSPEPYLGTNYYCVGVYTVQNGMRSSEVMSRTAAVTYSGIEILSLPAKTEYFRGETVRLKGLMLRVHDSSGGYWDSYNGNGVSVYPSKLDMLGSVAVEVSDGSSTATFYVNVRENKNTGENGDAKDPNHKHKFGEWEVTKEPTCMSTGIRVRKCECGATETEEIAKTDHTWDEGKVTKEATATTNGSILYTCKVCKANKSEIIPAGTVKPGPTTSLDAAQAQRNNVIINQGDPQAQNKGNNPSGAAGGGNGNTYSNMNPNLPGNGTNPGAPGSDMTQPYNPYSEDGSYGSVNGGQTGTDGDSLTAEGMVAGEEKTSSGWWLIPVSALLLVGVGIGAYYIMRKKGGE